jgi:hypothetical protein
MKVLGGMRVLGTVAASHMPALRAETQLHPGVSRPETVLTALGARRHVPYVIQMCTGSHGSLSGFRVSAAIRLMLNGLTAAPPNLQGRSYYGIQFL